MKRTSIFALCLTLLIAAFGSSAFGQITVNGDTSVFDKPAAAQPRLGTYGGGDDERFRRNIDGTLAAGPQYQYLITVEPRAGNNYPLSGRAMLRGGQYTISGTLYGRSGTFRAVAHRQGEPDEYFDGTGTADGLVITYFYDRGRKHKLTIPLKFVSGSYTQQQTASAPKPQPQMKPVPAGATFGLVSKVLGHVPPPGEGNNSIVSGSMDERSYRVETRMKPPYNGYAFVAHHYSSPLTSRLTPGQVVELTCWSEAERTGRDAPNVASICQWGVSGNGAEVIESTHTFAGTAGDGKFYPSSQAVTRFKVLRSGTITIVAGQNGGSWGAGSDNWNPATYVYKSGEIPTASVNQ